MSRNVDDARVVGLEDVKLHRDEQLTQRLEDGYRRISDAVDHGVDVAAWEQFWLDLLSEYESLYDVGDGRLAA